jgi:hypothetical protein
MREREDVYVQNTEPLFKIWDKLNESWFFDEILIDCNGAFYRKDIYNRTYEELDREQFEIYWS